ncbi:hypothetical protein H4Q26_008433 [Puccinia striiformis f. sp. tritici PST-130]|nr:hypothetical protein H4Q26_008433 [Puccinia striiformis f. sp. tritici PST-130]
MSLNFIPIFAAMHLVTERELPWDQRVHEASQDKIQAAINGPFIELPNNKGSTIQRKKRIQHEMIAWKAGIKMDPSEYMKFNFGWTTGLGRLELPEFLSVKDYGNSALVVFKKNGRLSLIFQPAYKDISSSNRLRKSSSSPTHTHFFSQIEQCYIEFSKIPLASVEGCSAPSHLVSATFSHTGGIQTPEERPSNPNREFRNINGRKVAALIEYLNENDVYGWIGLPPPAVLPFRQSSELHPTEKDVWVSQSGVAVTRQEAAEAMRWSEDTPIDSLLRGFHPLVMKPSGIGLITV